MKKQSASQNKPTIPPPFIMVGFLVFFGLVICTGFFLFYESYTHTYHHAKTIVKSQIKIKVNTTPNPTPPIDMALQNSFKTYSNTLYGFSVTYPALGESSSSSLTTCGNNIEETTIKNNDEIEPTIYIDSLYTIILHPWGGQLADYIQRQDSQAQKHLTIVKSSYPNVDETVFFYTLPQELYTGYFANTLALFKKGNLIFQLDIHKSKGLGCQALFDPRTYNEIPLINPQSFPNKQNLQTFQIVLYNQYKYWNEATSIHFGSTQPKPKTE